MNKSFVPAKLFKILKRMLHLPSLATSSSFWQSKSLRRTLWERCGRCGNGISRPECSGWGEDGNDDVERWWKRWWNKWLKRWWKDDGKYYEKDDWKDDEKMMDKIMKMMVRLFWFGRWSLAVASFFARFGRSYSLAYSLTYGHRLPDLPFRCLNIQQMIVTARKDQTGDVAGRSAWTSSLLGIMTLFTTCSTTPMSKVKEWNRNT